MKYIIFVIGIVAAGCTHMGPNNILFQKTVTDNYS